MLDDYKSYSVAALKAETDSVTRLKILVSQMDKPANFTYIDTLNLHQLLEKYERELKKLLEDKRKQNE